MNIREMTLSAGMCAAAIVAFGAPAQADRLADVLARGKLIIGTGSTNPQWHFRDEAGNLAGFDVDVAKIVAKGLFDDPEKVEFVIQASDARVPNVVTDKVDITCQFMTVTAARAQLVNFTIPYYREGVGLLMMKGGKYASHEAMKGAGAAVTVSVLQNVYAEEMVHQALPEDRISPLAQAGLRQQFVHLTQTHVLTVDQIIIMTVTVRGARQSHLREIDGQPLFGIVKGDRGLRHACARAVLRAGEDHVLGLLAAQKRVRLLAQHPAQ